MIQIVTKPILPSLREKKRYIVYEVKTEKPLKFGEVKQELEKKMVQFLGELGYGKAGIMVMDNWENNKGIIKTNTKYVDEVKAALALTEKVGNQKVIIRSVGVSGILKKVKNKFLKGGR